MSETLIPFPDKKYQIIYADPPWSFTRGVSQDSGRKDRIIVDQYRTMNKKDIENINVSNITENDAVLFLWVTDSHLIDGIELIRKWGFEYRTIAFIWKKITKNGKTCANVGAWTMKNCEICLLGIKGNMLQHKKVNNIFQFVEAERTSHSKKPEQVRYNIETLFGNLSRIELFARQQTPGWDVWGDEVVNEEITCNP